MTLYERMRSEHDRLVLENKSLSQTIARLPDGKLVCCHGKNSQAKWYVSDGKTKNYITKKDRRQAEMLAQKKLFQAQMKDNIAEIRAIDFYLSHHRKDYWHQEQVMEDAEIQNLLSTNYGSIPQELEHWATAPYVSSKKYPEKLIHKTLSGNMVRSKSEALIANMLYMHGIPFRYEEESTIAGVTVYPDFKVRRRYDGKVFVWEHFGMMDSQQYVEKCIKKTRLYIESGIIPSVDLIATYETNDVPLDSELVEKLIEHYLL